MEDPTPAAAAAPPDSSKLPPSIVESLAVSNGESIGGQPAILANLALANQIFNANLQQQNAVALQQAVNQLRVAVVARCADLVLETKNVEELPPLIDRVQAVLDQLGQLSVPTVQPPLV